MFSNALILLPFQLHYVLQEFGTIPISFCIERLLKSLQTAFRCSGFYFGSNWCTQEKELSLHCKGEGYQRSKRFFGKGANFIDF